MRMNTSMRADLAWPRWAGVPFPVAEGPSCCLVLALYESAKNVTIFLNPYVCCSVASLADGLIRLSVDFHYSVHAPPLTPLYEMYQAWFDLWELLQKDRSIFKKSELKVLKMINVWFIGRVQYEKHFFSSQRFDGGIFTASRRTYSHHAP